MYTYAHTHAFASAKQATKLEPNMVTDGARHATYLAACSCGARDRLVEHTAQQGAECAVADRPDPRRHRNTRIDACGDASEGAGAGVGRCKCVGCALDPALALRTAVCMVLPAVLTPCGPWRRQTLVVIECHGHGITRVPGSRQIRLQPADTLCVPSALTRLL